MVDINSIDFGSKVDEFKLNLIESRKYWIIYLIFVLVASLSMFGLSNYISPMKELVFVLLIAVFGVFAITFYSYHNSETEIYKTAFVIIILFGLLCCFLNPICNVSDETEHLARADITSQGVLFPEYVNGSFEVSSSISFFEVNRTLTAFDVDGNTDYNDTLIQYQSAFQQNPFYGYIPQALGLLIAKLLDLSVLSAMWLGRIFNLLLYAGLIAYAVKKTPIFKVPFIAMACIPVAIQQAASFSIDSMFIGLGFVVFAYFFYMLKAEDNSLENRDIIIFSALCLLLGLCKLPFLATILLIFCIPTNKFRPYNSALFKFIGLFAVGIIGLLFATVATPNYMHSGWRIAFAAQRNINSTAQMSYMLSHPGDSLVAIFQSINSLDYGPVLTALTNLYSTVPGAATMHRIGFFSAIIPMFVGAIWFFYPNTEKFSLKERLGPLIVMAIIYIGMSISQILTWAPVGNLFSVSMHTRYVLPLFVLIPFIFGMNHVSEKNNEIDSYIICLTCGFIAAFLIRIVTMYY